MARQQQNSQRPPAPILSPMLGEKGYAATPWISFFTSLADVIDYGPTMVDTHANRINTDSQATPFYAPARFFSYLYLESDTGALYLSVFAGGSGVVSTSGVNVTLVSGQAFPTSWVGSIITINSVNYTVATVPTGTTMTLTATAGTQTNVPYSQAGAATWLLIYADVYGASLANLPTGLGISDAGYQFSDQTLMHTYRWDGLAWSFSATDDHMAGQICASAGGAAPRAGAWHVCDGTAATVSKGDGTTVSVTTPNLAGDVTLKGAASQSAQQAAAAATWDGAAVTDDESAHTHQVTEPSSNLGNVTTGATAFFGVAGGTVVSGPGTAHHHALSNGNAKLNPPSESNGGLGLRIALVWYMRR